MLRKLNYSTLAATIIIGLWACMADTAEYVSQCTKEYKGASSCGFDTQGNNCSWVSSSDSEPKWEMYHPDDDGEEGPLQTDYRPTGEEQKKGGYIYLKNNDTTPASASIGTLVAKGVGTICTMFRYVTTQPSQIDIDLDVDGKKYVLHTLETNDTLGKWTWFGMSCCLKQGSKRKIVFTSRVFTNAVTAIDYVEMRRSTRVCDEGSENRCFSEPAPTSPPPTTAPLPAITSNPKSSVVLEEHSPNPERTTKQVEATEITTFNTVTTMPPTEKNELTTSTPTTTMAPIDSTEIRTTMVPTETTEFTTTMAPTEMTEITTPMPTTTMVPTERTEFTTTMAPTETTEITTPMPTTTMIPTETTEFTTTMASTKRTEITTSKPTTTMASTETTEITTSKPTTTMVPTETTEFTTTMASTETTEITTSKPTTTMVPTETTEFTTTMASTDTTEIITSKPTTAKAPLETTEITTSKPTTTMVPIETTEFTTTMASTETTIITTKMASSETTVITTTMAPTQTTEITTSMPTTTLVPIETTETTITMPTTTVTPMQTTKFTTTSPTETTEVTTFIPAMTKVLPETAKISSSLTATTLMPTVAPEIITNIMEMTKVHLRANESIREELMKPATPTPVLNENQIKEMGGSKVLTTQHKKTIQATQVTSTKNIIKKSTENITNSSTDNNKIETNIVEGKNANLNRHQFVGVLTGGLVVGLVFIVIVAGLIGLCSRKGDTRPKDKDQLTYSNPMPVVGMDDRSRTSSSESSWREIDYALTFPTVACDYLLAQPVNSEPDRSQVVEDKWQIYNGDMQVSQNAVEDGKIDSQEKSFLNSKTSLSTFVSISVHRPEASIINMSHDFEDSLDSVDEHYVNIRPNASAYRSRMFRPLSDSPSETSSGYSIPRPTLRDSREEKSRPRVSFVNPLYST